MTKPRKGQVMGKGRRKRQTKEDNWGKADTVFLMFLIFFIFFVGWIGGNVVDYHDVRSLLFPEPENWSSDSSNSGPLFFNSSFTVRDFNMTLVSKQTYPETHNITISKRGNITKILIDHPCIETAIGIGNSMRPFMKYKDVAIVDTCPDPSLLDIGDIVTFDVGFMKIRHRIIEINHSERWFVTQGDNLEVDDGRISFSRLVSKTIGFLNIYEDHEGDSWKEIGK